jgi:nicotinate dehydrogenase subunit B
MSAVLSRRALLAAGGGLVVAFSLRAQEPVRPGSLKETPILDAWIRVAVDGRVTVFTGKAELGQGLTTALLQVAAEQLDVAPGQIELVTADTMRTPNEGFTAGSHSMQDSGTAIMNAAAQVRGLLRDAAAAEFGVAAETLSTAGGSVHAADGRSIGYGPLAAKLNLHVEASASSPLKNPAAYRLMGTPLQRIDIPAKLTGGASYVQDMRLPGMLHARVVRQPSVGAKLLDFDTGPVERMPGVVRVVREGSYLAVVASGEWQAIKAMRVLSAAAKWDETASLPDEATVLQTIQALPARNIPVLTWNGAAGSPVKRLKARYTRPYLMHGAIGPSCSVAQFSDGTMTVWTHRRAFFRCARRWRAC